MATVKPKSTAKVLKAKGPTIVTPIGKALFVSAPNPSAFDDGKQEATILLSAADAEVVKAKLQAFIDSPDAKALGIPDTGFVDAAFKDDTDADGNLTGMLRLKAKTKAEFTVKFYDAKGAPFTPAPGFQVQNRSDIRLSILPEFMKTSMFTGLTFRLQAIKVISAPSFGDDGMSGMEDDGDFVAPTAASSYASDAMGGDDSWD